MGRGRAWGAGGAGGRALFPFIIVFEGFFRNIQGLAETSRKLGLVLN